MREKWLPLALGWLLSVWLPPPRAVRTIAGAALAAVMNGASAVLATIRPQK